MRKPSVKVWIEDADRGGPWSQGCKLQHWRGRRYGLAAVACIISLVGCRTPERSDTTAPAATTSVPAGINDNFRDPNLDVDNFVERFEGESREIFAARDEIVGALNLKPGMDVADIGAGTGLFTMPFARAVAPGGRVFALDIAPRFVEHIDARARESGLVNVEARRCAEDDVELPKGCVDVAFVCDTYHHFEYPQATLASIFKAVRSGGSLVIVELIREPGVSREWILNHVRAGQDVFRAEIEAAGFKFVEEVKISGLKENYFIRFRRP